MAVTRPGCQSKGHPSNNCNDVFIINASVQFAAGTAAHCHHRPSSRLGFLNAATGRGGSAEAVNKTGRKRVLIFTVHAINTRPGGNTVPGTQPPEYTEKQMYGGVEV
jgi:hypothetical protein